MKYQRFLTAVCLCATVTVCHAKIGDCPAISDGNVIYQSHADNVQAIDKQGNILWDTEVIRGIDFGLWLPMMEADAQANISCVEKLENQQLLVTDKRNYRFVLDNHTGKIIATQNIEPFPSDTQGRIIYLLLYYGGLVELSVLLAILGLGASVGAKCYRRFK